MRRPSSWAIAIAIAAALTLLTVSSNSVHPATGVPLFAFHVSCVLLIALAFPKPRLHVYTALAMVLFLGYWPKFLLRLIDPIPYLEPIGRFDGTSANWDQVLLVVAVGLWGAMLPRIAHLLWARTMPRPETVAPVVPWPYLRYRAAVWVCTALGITGAYAWNTHASVYVTGVNPVVVLPFALNVVLAWCYILAFPLWIALLVGWELQRRHTNALGWSLLLIPMAEGVLNAGSLLSRAAYLLRIAPYLLASTRHQEPYGPIRVPRPRVATGVALVTGFALSVVAVMALRTIVYLRPVTEAARVTSAPTPTAAPAPAPNPAASDAVQAPAVRQADPIPPSAPPAPPSLTELRPVSHIAHEVGTLFLDRWTGLEGVLAVTSSRRGPDVLSDMIYEDPQRGTESIYQKMADAPYEQQERFTFLTLAGIIALLAAGDSWWLILLGMSLTTAVLLLAEWATRRITRNEIACSVVAVTTAFVASQVTYPRLFGVFLLELWTTLGCLALLMWVLRRTAPPREARS